MACFAAHAQTQTPPPATSVPAANSPASGAPLQLLAPLPNPQPQVGAPLLPEARKPAEPVKVARPIQPPVPPVPPVATEPAPQRVDLPPAQPPQPVTSSLFGATSPAPASPPSPVAVVAPPVVAPTAPPAIEAKPAAPKLADEKPADAKVERKLTVIVAGDSIADGIWGGLYRKLLRDKRYEIVRKARNSSGFVAFDWVEELRATDELKRADAVIFLAGTNDRQSLVSQGKPRHLFGTKAWEEGYSERVIALMQSLKGQNIPLVWISLPIARKDEFNKDSRYLNNLFAQAAKQAGVHYIDIWTMFADKDGQYAAYLPDADGRNRLMRDNDGIHFTPRGYEMIADAVLEKLQKTVPVFQQAAMAEPADKAAAAKSGKAN